MAHLLGLGSIALALLGLAALTLQLLLVMWHVSRPKKSPTLTPPISILKPLCGVDDSLEENLAAFADLDYPDYEVVLGVKDHRDSAFEVALRFTRKFPGRFRLILQRGEPGHNPKVNQLVTLEKMARHDILLVSDSNARVPRGYLSEVAALFEDPTVGCVTHPVLGWGERSWGSVLDNLHMSTSVGSGMIGAKLFAGQDVVVGKSMALRRADLEALGGFRAMANVLAEDYVMGRAVRDRLGKKVALARTRVSSVSTNRDVTDFWRRYARWSVIHRTALQPTTYLAQVMLNPIALALTGAAIRPTRDDVLAMLGVVVVKTGIDVATAHALGHRLHVRLLPAVVVKDLLVFATWARGLVVRTVDWRGHQLRVRAGSRLVEEPRRELPSELLP